MSAVILLFGDNPVAYNAAAILDFHGYKAVAMVPSKGRKTFLKSKFYSCVKFSKYKWHEELFAKELVQEFFNDKQKKIIIPTNDLAIECLLKHNKFLKKFFIINGEEVGRVYNKLGFYNLLSKFELPIPKTWINKDIKKITYPCIVKPVIKDGNNSFIKKYRKKFLSINDFSEAKKILNEFKGDVIFQEKIDIAEEYSWCGVRLKNQKILSFISEHIETFPDYSGRISAAKLCENEEVKKLGDKLVQKMDYYGIADIQVAKEKESGSYKIIEMNPRLWCSHELLEMNDISLLKYLVGNYYNEELTFYNIDNNDSNQWYSIMYNIGKNKAQRKNNTEFYRMNEDNYYTKIKIRIFLFLKYFYYSINKRL